MILKISVSKLCFFHESLWSKNSFFHWLLFSRNFWMEFKRRPLIFINSSTSGLCSEEDEDVQPPGGGGGVGVL